MPCQDSVAYRDWEIEDQSRIAREKRVKELTRYVSLELGLIHTPLHDHQANTRFLCEKIRKMTNTQLNKIVYDGRSKTARDLADWWEEHQEIDREREKQEQEKARVRKLRKSALAKLTDEERKILGI